MVDFLYLWLYYMLRFIAIYTPKAIQNIFFDLLAKGFYKFDKKHTNIMRINLKMCKFENIEEIILQTYRNFAHFGVEFLRNQNSTKEQILSKVEFKDAQILDKFKEENVDILVGTQMISKGHDIENVTLVLLLLGIGRRCPIQIEN